MVKPQSSKLITRVRFPSSPRDLGSRRFRVEALSFSLEGMTGIPSACGFVSSRARNPHAPARHPLAQIPAKVAGNRFRAKIHSLARSGFSPSSPSSPRELISGIRLRMRIYFLARSESARSSSSSPPHHRPHSTQPEQSSLGRQPGSLYSPIARRQRRCNSVPSCPSTTRTPGRQPWGFVFR